jgi:hypothetical protein
VRTVPLLPNGRVTSDPDFKVAMVLERSTGTDDGREHRHDDLAVSSWCWDVARQVTTTMLLVRKGQIRCDLGLRLLVARCSHSIYGMWTCCDQGGFEGPSSRADNNKDAEQSSIALSDERSFRAADFTCRARVHQQPVCNGIVVCVLSFSSRILGMPRRITHA